MDLDWGTRISQQHIVPLFFFLVALLAVRPTAKTLIAPTHYTLPLTPQGASSCHRSLHLPPSPLSWQLLVLVSLASCVKNLLFRCLRCVTCGCVSDAEAEDAVFRAKHKLPPFPEYAAPFAFRLFCTFLTTSFCVCLLTTCGWGVCVCMCRAKAKYLRGLPSYSILQNPLYARAFGISREFAAQHSNVASVRNFRPEKRSSSATAGSGAGSSAGAAADPQRAAQASATLAALATPRRS